MSKTYYLKLKQDNGITRRCKLMTSSGKKVLISNIGRLPTEYQEVEWIGSTGTQYIDTGIKPSENYRIKLRATFTENVITKNSTLFGSNSTGNYRYWVNYDNNFEIGYGGYQSTSITVEPNEIFDIDFNYIEGGAHKFNIKGTVFNKAGTPNTTENIILFGRNVNGGVILSQMKLYSFQIFDNTSLLRDLIPCYRKSDSVIGMYDIVNDVFYDNDGTGTFQKGNDV